MSNIKEYIDEVVSKIPTSKPIFVAQPSDNDIYFELKDKQLVDTDSFTDPVDQLIAATVTETFEKNRDRKKSRFVRSCRTDGIFQKIGTVVIAVYEKHCGLKNPRQSRTYKWLYSACNSINDEQYNGIVALYRYIAKNTDVHSRRFDGQLDQAHANNVLAILEKMRNKYED